MGNVHHQVCLDGHWITGNYPNDKKDFCDQCGEPTIHECPSCRNPIKGNSIQPYCENCGKPYPWTAKKQKHADEINEEQSSDPLLSVEQVCTRFHLVVRQLRERHDDRHLT